MQITWYGEGCFKLVEGGLTFLIDPLEKESGLSTPRFKADVVLSTRLVAPQPEDPKPLGGITEETHTIAGPGEYEVKGVRISGWPLMKSSTEKELHSVFKITVDELRVAILGGLSGVNEQDIITNLGDVDVLIIPGGGAPYLDQSDAAKLIRQIGPRVVVPSFFAVAGLKRKADDVRVFLKEIGHDDEKPNDKISIKKKDLTEKMQVFVPSL